MIWGWSHHCSLPPHALAPAPQALGKPPLGLVHMHLLLDARKGPCQGWPSCASGQELGKAHTRAESSHLWPLAFLCVSSPMGSDLSWPLIPRHICHHQGSLHPGSHATSTLSSLSAPRQPQKQTPVGGPHAEVGLKPQLSCRGYRAKGKNAEISPHSCANCELTPPQLTWLKTQRLQNI